jgi:hypothetical protein
LPKCLSLFKMVSWINTLKTTFLDDRYSHTHILGLRVFGNTPSGIQHYWSIYLYCRTMLRSCHLADLNSRATQTELENIDRHISQLCLAATLIYQFYFDTVSISIPSVRVCDSKLNNMLSISQFLTKIVNKFYCNFLFADIWLELQSMSI